MNQAVAVGGVTDVSAVVLLSLICGTNDLADLASVGAELDPASLEVEGDPGRDVCLAYKGVYAGRPFIYCDHFDRWNWNGSTLSFTRGCVSHVFHPYEWCE